MRVREKVAGMVTVLPEYEAGVEDQILLPKTRSYAQTLAMYNCFTMLH